jgi:hypothetical protein
MVDSSLFKFSNRVRIAVSVPFRVSPSSPFASAMSPMRSNAPFWMRPRSSSVAAIGAPRPGSM